MLSNACASQPSEIDAFSASSSGGPAASSAQFSSIPVKARLRHPMPAATAIAPKAVTPSAAVTASSVMPAKGPNIIAGTRSIASPITPPNPVGSGQVAVLGRQDANPEASMMPTNHRSARHH